MWKGISKREKTGTRDISNDNAVAHHLLGPLIQKGEHAGVDDIESAVGIALFDDAGDVDFTGTCEGEDTWSAFYLQSFPSACWNGEGKVVEVRIGNECLTL